MPEILCHFCSEVVDTKAVRSYRKVEGWIANRKQGGSNSIAMPSDHGQWAHGGCIDQQKQRGGVSWNQNEMF